MRKIEIPQFAQEARRSKISRTTLEKRRLKSKILSIRLLSGLSTEQSEPGASSTRFGRDDPLRSSRQWRCRRKPSTSNVRRARRSKETSRAKSIRRNKEQPDCDSVEQHLSVQDPGAHGQPKQKRTRDQPAYLRQEVNKPKTVKTKEAKSFSKSETEMVDAMDTLQHAVSVIESEIAKKTAFLQKEIDTRNTNNATVALIDSLQQRVSMMRRTRLTTPLTRSTACIQSRRLQ